MKNWYLLFLILFFMSSGAFAMPDNLYDENNQKPIIYDASYNIALRNKLENDFHKKYPATLSYDKDGYPVYSHNYPPEAYYWEVQVPYDLNKKPDDYKIISK